jgi:predicted DNA repair protein MutK
LPAGRRRTDDRRHARSGAVRTDFILSAEIIAITLGTVAAAAFTQRRCPLARQASARATMKKFFARPG